MISYLHSFVLFFAVVCKQALAPALRVSSCVQASSFGSSQTRRFRAVFKATEQNCWGAHFEFSIRQQWRIFLWWLINQTDSFLLPTNAALLSYHFESNMFLDNIFPSKQPIVS